MLNQQTTTYEHITQIRRTTSTLRLNQRVILNMRLGTVVMNINDDLVLGRDSQPNTPHNFVDLSKFGGLSAGVSRKHAYFVRDDNEQIFIADINSSNGTYLNEELLHQDELYPLDNGDVLRLGTLIIHVMFE